MSERDTPYCTLGLTSERLSAWRSHLLGEAESARILAHLPKCQECQHSLAQFDEVARQLRGLQELEPGNRLWNQVQKGIMQSSERNTTMKPRVRWSGIGLAAATLVILFVFVQFLHSRTPGSVSTASATVQKVTCQGSLLGCSAKPGLVGTAAPITNQGITLQVTYAYSDALSTSLSVTLSSSTLTLGNATIQDATITDAAGHTLLTAQAVNGSVINSQEDENSFALLPLSPTQLRQPEHLVFTAHQIILNQGKPISGFNQTVTGTWQIPFTVNPVLGTQYQIQAAPVTNLGVHFQVTSLEVVSVTPTSGGVRIILTATGVPADTLLDSFAPWYETTASLVTSCPAMGCQPRPGPTSAVLSLPGFTVGQVQNGISVVVSPTGATEKVGSTQTVQIELLFPGTGTLTEANGTLTITNFHLFRSLALTAADLQETAAWQISLPLHS